MHIHGYSYQNTVKNKTKIFCAVFRCCSVSENENTIIRGRVGGVYVYWRIYNHFIIQRHRERFKTSYKTLSESNGFKTVFYDRILKAKMLQTRKRSSGWSMENE